MKYRIDFHVHSENSRDALGSLQEISYFARKREINAVAIADHDTFSLEEVVEVNGVYFIPAIELRTFVGHVVCLLPKKRFNPKAAYHDPIEIIHKVEGYAIWAHPFDRVFFKKIKTVVPDAIEVYNSASFPFKSSSSKAFLLAHELNVPMVAGSDAHIPEDVGLCYVEVDASSILDAVEKVFFGKGSLYGNSRPLSHMIKLVFGRILKKLG
ncbi:MAG: PHP domain-containing protein [Nitrososphaeria archaeon]|nr:PHP domain-containing protein [Nitrososphaeria archaeon]